MQTTLAQRNMVRAYVNERNPRQPVHVIPGDRAPHYRGESYYWTWTPNPNGTRVRHAAGRAKYRCYYHASTLVLCVGATWLAHGGEMPPSRAAAYDTHAA